VLSPIDTPNQSSTRFGVMHFDTSDISVSRAVLACTRIPVPRVGIPGGTSVDRSRDLIL
jgi:hypothetical protein